jgi:hypothetical protein
MGFRLIDGNFDVLNLDVEKMMSLFRAPKDGDIFKALGFDELGAVVSGPPGTSPPDASLTAKGIVQLAGDLGGTASAPKLLKPASGTATALAGFDATGSLVSTDVLAVIPKRHFLRQFSRGAGVLSTLAQARILDSVNQVTQINGNPIDVATFTFVSGTDAVIRELLTAPHNFKLLDVVLTISSTSFPPNEKLVVSMKNAITSSLIAQDTTNTSSSSEICTSRLSASVFGGTDLLVTEGFYITISTSANLTYDSLVITCATSEDIL